jgi:putative nucleotidyltransferase with HDIG domain
MRNMEDWIKIPTRTFESYVNSFTGLSPLQHHNFIIKKEHSLRVAENSGSLAEHLKLDDEDAKVAVLAGIFHDIGRFKQLTEYNTFNDAESFDHADYAIEIIMKNGFLSHWNSEVQQIIYKAIQLHNKFEIPQNLAPRELLHARILRDADKLDILKVLTDYYTDKNQAPNHTLTWELPVARQVSPGVAREVLSGKLVSKHLVKSDVDVKIMQLSWVYDLNYRFSVSMVLKNRFMERIYGSLPKNDTTIEIYRKIKVYAENKLME